MNNFVSGWYVIYTKPRHEKKVHTLLAEKKINSFVPTKKVLRVWHDRRKYVDEPLFPSYIFVFLSDLQSYYYGMNVEGSMYYVKTGKQIARVNESIIKDIRLVTENINDIEVSDRRFFPGQKALISKGPLTGIACELVEVEKQKMVLIRVELLQRNILIFMNTGDLMLA